jgi:uncharacterized protein YndB with AHSA1/START domain
MSDALVIDVVRKTITVDCAVEEAFDIFTADTLSWWPVETHSLAKSVREIVFEPEAGGEVYEVAESGERGHWATIVAWEPPSRLVLAWNVGNASPAATEVEVRFVADGARTRVELEHRGWEALGEPGVTRRGEYDTGWDYVLGAYVEHIR